MKKTLLKDTFREIKKTIGRFLAILFIVALGTAFFVGVKTTCPDMKLTADKYYKDNNLMDFRLISTLGFTDDDINTIKSTSGVKGVMPSYFIDAMAPFNGKQRVLTISSIPISNLSNDNINYINRPTVISGRLPEKSGECVIESNKITNINPKIGDKIVLSSGDDSDLNDKLNTLEYTVVGIVNSPLYVSNERGTTKIGNGQVYAFMIIPDIDFKLEYYNSIYLTADIDSKIQAYSTQYDDATAPLKATLDDLSKTREDLRYNDIKSDAQSQLSDKQKEYETSVDEANTKFADAEQKIIDSQKQLDDARVELEQNKQLLADKNQQLINSRKQFDKEVADAQDKINQAQTTLDDAQKKYDSNLNEFNTQKQKAIDAGAYEMYKDQLDKAQAQLDDAKKQIDDNNQKLQDSKQQFETTKADNQKRIDDAQAQLDDAKKQIEDAQIKIDDSQKDLDNAKKEYEDTKADTNQKLADAQAKLDDAQNQINDIPSVKWYVLDRNSNYGYMDYSNAADRMNAISQVFPVIFILVAILICLTSMGRMVEEQRQYMGIAKALGYRKSSIVVKFLLYAVFASVLGGILGLSIGFSIFPSVLNRAYSIIYTMPKMILIFDIPFAIISFVIGILVTALTALFVSLGELNSSAAALMRPRAPKAGKKVFLEKIGFIWTRLKFTQKVTMRNIIRYKSRFFMTIFGVGGCTALLLVGFGLNDAITTIGDRQYNEIYKAQFTINLKDDITQDQINIITNTLENQPEFSAWQKTLEKSVDIGLNGTEKTCNLIVPDSALNFNQFISLHDRITGTDIPITDNGAVLSEKLAKKIGAKVGDTIYIKNDDDKLSVQVTGICENYLQHFIYLSPALYEKLYGNQPDFNIINVKLKTTDAAAQQNVSKNVVSLDGIMSVNLISDNIQRFNDIIKSIYNIVLVLIVSAALLSFTVLFTLTNININERIREIATIKVLGFYDKEVSAYVFRGNIILTIIGTIFGLFIGIPLTHYVIGTAEVDMLMFGREIFPLSYVLAAIFTIAFALIVNFAMLKRLKKINMVEALKTVE